MPVYTFREYVDAETSDYFDDLGFDEAERKYFADYLIYCKQINYEPICGVDF